jgi:hypothetical protein
MAVPVVDTYDDRQGGQARLYSILEPESELNPFQPHSKHRQFRVSGFLFHLDNPLGIGSDLLQSRVENHSRPDKVPKVPEHYEPRTMANPNQYFLLADHIKLSLLERQRAISLNLEPTSQDGHISRSLESLREGVESVTKERIRLQQAGETS